jgi:2'-5' RNA ligase
MKDFGDLHKIRAFIAVPVTDEVRQTVAKVEGDLKGSGADVKWVEPEKIHVTLKFLGDTKTRQIEGLVGALRNCLAGVKPFDITLSGSGTFPPGRRNVRVVWLGTTEGKEQLGDLAAKVEDACASQGFAKEGRPFSAHLTIGRVRRESRRLEDLSAAVAKVEYNPLKVRIDRVNLVRSELSPKGPTYTVLESFSLERA